MTDSFDFYCPTRVVFGKEAEKQVGKLIKEYNASHVLIVYGGKSAVRSGLLELVRNALV